MYLFLPNIQKSSHSHNTYKLCMVHPNMTMQSLKFIQNLFCLAKFHAWKPVVSAFLVSILIFIWHIKADWIYSVFFVLSHGTKDISRAENAKHSIEFSRIFRNFLACLLIIPQADLFERIIEMQWSTYLPEVNKISNISIQFYCWFVIFFRVRKYFRHYWSILENISQSLHIPVVYKNEITKYIALHSDTIDWFLFILYNWIILTASVLILIATPSCYPLMPIVVLYWLSFRLDTMWIIYVNARL